ncbi:MAG TPA: iron ABC transporter permease [Candidatus Korarchaeota archaeon]|nr:iron ABC transporter permease [Candidatus Korarchaeota archaeon]
MSAQVAGLYARLKLTYRRFKWEMDAFSWTQLILVLSVFVAFMLVPLTMVILRSFYSATGGFSLDMLKSILQDKYYFPLRIHLTGSPPFISIEGIRGTFYEVIQYTRPSGEVIKIIYIKGWDFGVLVNSLVVASCTALFSTILGFTLAFIFAKYKFPGSEALRIISLIPLLSTPFVGAIGIKKMIVADGVLNVLFHDVLNITPFKIEITGLPAVILVQTLLFYPIVMLNAYTALISIDPSLEEQAMNMGASGFKLFRTVTLPLATPGIEAGALLVFILALEDLGTPIVFKGTTAEKVLTFQIFNRIFTPAGLISQEATSLALILLVISAIVFIAVRRYVSLKRYAMLGKGGVWRPRRRNLSLKVTVLVYLFVFGVLFFATLPHIGVTLLAFAKQWGATILPDSFTLDNFRAVLADEQARRCIVNSLVFSGVATLLMVVLGVSAAYLVSRKRHLPGMEALDLLVTLPIAVPGIAVATGLFLTYLGTPLSPTISGAPLLIAAYTVRKIPFTVRAVFSGLEQTDKTLDEVAWTVGASRTRTFFTIILPLILLNVLAGGMLSFIYSMSEVSTGIVVGDANHRDAPMTWKMYDMLFHGLAGGLFQPAAMGFMLMALQFVFIVGANLLLRKRATALIGV